MIRYVLEDGATEVGLDLEACGPDQYRVLIHGPDGTTRSREVSLTVAGDRYSLLLDGVSYLVDLWFRDDTVTCLLDGTPLEFVCQSEIRRQRRSLKAADKDETDVVTRMPGRVIELLVHPGERVERDQGLVVLEAMKMENKIVAPRPGVVAEVCVSPGADVDAGACLLRLAPSES